MFDLFFAVCRMGWLGGRWNEETWCVLVMPKSASHVCYRYQNDLHVHEQNEMVPWKVLVRAFRHAMLNDEPAERFLICRTFNPLILFEAPRRKQSSSMKVMPVKYYFYANVAKRIDWSRRDLAGRPPPIRMISIPRLGMFAMIRNLETHTTSCLCAFSMHISDERFALNKQRDMHDNRHPACHHSKLLKWDDFSIEMHQCRSQYSNRPIRLAFPL